MLALCQGQFITARTATKEEPRQAGQSPLALPHRRPQERRPPLRPRTDHQQRRRQGPARQDPRLGQHPRTHHLRPRPHQRHHASGLPLHQLTNGHAEKSVPPPDPGSGRLPRGDTARRPGRHAAGCAQHRQPRYPCRRRPGARLPSRPPGSAVAVGHRARMPEAAPARAWTGAAPGPAQTSSGTSRCAKASSNSATSMTRIPVSCTRSARRPMAVSAAWAIASVES